jgi:hypothetical protein
VFQKELYNGVQKVAERQVLRKGLHLKECKLSIVQGVERCMVCTPLSVNVLATLARQQHFEYNCKDIFETPALPLNVTLNRNFPG